MESLREKLTNKKAQVTCLMDESTAVKREIECLRQSVKTVCSNLVLKYLIVGFEITSGLYTFSHSVVNIIFRAGYQREGCSRRRTPS